MQKTNCAVYGEGAVTDHGMCQKWFAKFCAGDFLLDDAPRSGIPVEVASDQTKTLIENNQFFFKILFIYFIEREGREKEGKHQCVVASYAPPTEDLACNPGMGPDWELNW